MMRSLATLQAKAAVRAVGLDGTHVPAAVAVLTDEGRPCWFPPDAILTERDVARVLDVSPRTVKAWGIRKAYCSGTTIRYLFRDVVAFLDGKAA